MMSRHAIRKQLFMLLFRADFFGMDEIPEQEERFFTQKDIEDREKVVDLWAEDEPEEESEERFSEEDKKEISDKFHSIMEILPEIDGQLNEKMSGWSTDRIGKVELTILRIALYEMNEEKKVSCAVAINEAVELAKKYGTEKSAEFVNGVLAKFAHEG